MTDHNMKWVLALSNIKAALVGDVLCVELRGRFTAPRLSACLYRLRDAVARSDYGALVVNVMGARIQVTARELAGLWHGPEVCPLAARPCAVVFNAEAVHANAVYTALAKRLAGGQPAVIMGAFEGVFLLDATTWADARARTYRAEVARREIRANSPGSSDTPRRKRANGRDRA
jgi:hypothetical protein